MIVDFYAPWSQPSETIAPAFDELSAQHASVVFAKVDVDELEVRGGSAQAIYGEIGGAVDRFGGVGSLEGMDAAPRRM